MGVEQAPPQKGAAPTPPANNDLGGSPGIPILQAAVPWLHRHIATMHRLQPHADLLSEEATEIARAAFSGETSLYCNDRFNSLGSRSDDGSERCTLPYNKSWGPGMSSQFSLLPKPLLGKVAGMSSDDLAPVLAPAAKYHPSDELISISQLSPGEISPLSPVSPIQLTEALDATEDAGSAEPVVNFFPARCPRSFREQETPDHESLDECPASDFRRKSRRKTVRDSPITPFVPLKDATKRRRSSLRHSHDGFEPGGHEADRSSWASKSSSLDLKHWVGGGTNSPSTTATSADSSPIHDAFLPAPMEREVWDFSAHQSEENIPLCLTAAVILLQHRRALLQQSLALHEWGLLGIAQERYSLGNPKPAQSEGKCPVCGKGEDGGSSMVACDACNMWFHFHCVGYVERPISKYSQDSSSWYCPPCKAAVVKKQRRH